MAIVRFQQLDVWRDAHQMVLDVYRATRRFPKQEQFGLVTQMRRAAVSVPANIAEGFRRRGRQEKVRFYNIAESSLDELRYYLILAADLGYLPNGHETAHRLEAVNRMLFRLISAIARRS
jgi:four helix bundle protein